MIGNYKLGFFGAALIASLVACHPVKPPQSASSASASVECADANTGPTNVSREAREVIGSVSAVAPRTPCLTEAPPKQPAELPGLDDPMWRRDMP
jgi:hypothetical protein